MIDASFFLLSRDQEVLTKVTLLLFFVTISGKE